MDSLIVADGGYKAKIIYNQRQIDFIGVHEERSPKRYRLALPLSTWPAMIDKNTVFMPGSQLKPYIESCIGRLTQIRPK